MSLSNCWALYKNERTSLPLAIISLADQLVSLRPKVDHITKGSRAYRYSRYAFRLTFVVKYKYVRCVMYCLHLKLSISLLA
jgi:hypothetical protein